MKKTAIIAKLDVGNDDIRSGTVCYVLDSGERHKFRLVKVLTKSRDFKPIEAWIERDLFHNFQPVILGTEHHCYYDAKDFSDRKDLSELINRLNEYADLRG